MPEFILLIIWLLDIYALNPVILDNGIWSALTLCGSVSIANTAGKCSFLAPVFTVKT